MKRYKRGDMIYLSQDHTPMMLLEDERLSSLGERTADVYITTRKTIFKDIRLDWCRRIVRKPSSNTVKVKAWASFGVRIDGSKFFRFADMAKAPSRRRCFVVFDEKHLKGGE